MRTYEPGSPAKVAGALHTVTGFASAFDISSSAMLTSSSKLLSVYGDINNAWRNVTFIPNAPVGVKDCFYADPAMVADHPMMKEQFPFITPRMVWRAFLCDARARSSDNYYMAGVKVPGEGPPLGETKVEADTLFARLMRE